MLFTCVRQLTQMHLLEVIKLCLLHIMHACLIYASINVNAQTA